MKVNALGFRLKAIGKATLNDLANRLVHKSGNEFTFRNCERRIYCSVNTHKGEVFAVGLFLTIRDHKKFVQLTEKDGTIGVTITELDDDSRPFDFNFFVFHPSSGSGLYSHYYCSCSFPLFHAHLRDQYLRTNKTLEDGSYVDDSEKIRASKKKNLTFSMFHRRDNFEDAVKQLNEVKQFEYDILVPESMTDELQPIKNSLKLERRQIRFEAKLAGQTFWDRIVSLVPSTPGSTQRFRVVGTDSSGDRIPIDLVAPPDHFSQDEYDDLATDETLTLSDVGSSAYIKELLQVFDNRKDFFTAKTSN